LIVNHLYGADGMARLQGGGDINLMYQIGSPRKGTLRFRCNVKAITASRGAGANVVIRPVRDLPQPLDQQNVEPQILAHYRMTKGLMGELCRRGRIWFSEVDSGRMIRRCRAVTCRSLRSSTRW
jgi:hypothetical protein